MGKNGGVGLKSEMELQTQGIKYAGSKKQLIPQILSLAKETGAQSVWDGFSGTTRVSQAFAQAGYRTISSDLSVCIPPRDGWFTEHYGGDPEICSDSPNVLKKPFQRKNTQKADGIREEIDRLGLDPVTRAVALTSLILALDRVDSTLGHFSSYLRQWSPRSFRDLKLEIPHLWVNSQKNEVHRGEIFSLKSKIHADLAYFDPPYGSNNEKMPPSRVRYSAYYHFWTTLILNDRPALFGKAARRKDTSDLRSASVFEEFRRDPQTGRFLAVEAIRKLLAETYSPWTLLSYSSGGRATAEELMDAIHSVGKLRQFLKLDYRRNVMAEMKWTHEWLRENDEKNQEFLFLIEKKS